MFMIISINQERMDNQENIEKILMEERGTWMRRDWWNRIQSIYSSLGKKLNYCSIWYEKNEYKEVCIVNRIQSNRVFDSSLSTVLNKLTNNRFLLLSPLPDKFNFQLVIFWKSIWITGRLQIKVPALKWLLVVFTLINDSHLHTEIPISYQETIRIFF